MAACAMEGLGLYTEWPHGEHAHPERTTVPSAESAEVTQFHPSILLQDATFLNAVLPFALNQRDGTANRCRWCVWPSTG